MENIVFRYVDYSQSLLSALKNRRENDTLIVFSDYTLKRAFSDSSRTKLFQKPQEILKIEEFYSKFFTTEKIILKEAKRILTLFSSLPKKMKRELGMENYYDFISLADQFFRYYKEKNENLSKGYTGLQKWQLERIEKFEFMKGEYDRYLDENNFIPSDWIKSLENMDIDPIKNFKKLIIVDQLEFSNLEIVLLKKLSEFCKVEIVLQCSEKDFDTVNFKLKNLSFPPKERVNLEVFETGEEIEEGINLLLEFSRSKAEKNNDIFSPSPSGGRLNRILPKYFQSSIQETLDSTQLYLFLKGIYELLATREPLLKNAISLSVLETVIGSESFRKNYSISDEDIKIFYELLRDDFKYFAPECVETFPYAPYINSSLTGILTRIYWDIGEISSFTKVDHFIEFIKNNIAVEKIIEKNFSDISEKFFEALELAQSSEQLYGKKGLKEFFPDNTAQGIFNLIIKYMQNIELKEIEKTGFQPAGMIKPLHLAKERHGKNTYFIGITDENLPGKTGYHSFFTEDQKLLNGIKTSDDEKLLLKYRFFQGIFTSRICKIFFIKNENRGIRISTFLEEILLHYGLTAEKTLLDSDSLIKILKNSLDSQRISFPDLSEDYSLPKDDSDFKDGKIPMGAYAYSNLESCFYRFYLENIATLTPVSESYERNMSAKFLGTYVHSALEKIANLKYKEIRSKNDFFLSREYVERALLETFQDNRFKIPVHLDIYFREILMENIIGNILNFYSQLEEKFSHEEVSRFQAEKSSSERKPIIGDEVQIILNGRVDLLIESSGGNCIIDYKTGSRNDKQLDFYSIMMYDSERAAEKAIFNVLKGKIEWYSSMEPALTRDGLILELEKFLISSNYSLAEKKSACTYCIYENICRRELCNE